MSSAGTSTALDGRASTSIWSFAVSPALAMCDRAAATLPQSAFKPFGEVAGRAKRVVVQVLADALLDVGLVQSRSGATAAGATGGRSTRRTLRHHRRRSERGHWRVWGGCFADGAMRWHCCDLLTLVEAESRERKRERDPDA